MSNPYKNKTEQSNKYLHNSYNFCSQTNNWKLKTPVFARPGNDLCPYFLFVYIFLIFQICTLNNSDEEV